MSLSPNQPPSPPPLPVQSLDATESYTYNTYSRRPGIITAIAILSITIGSLGLIGGGLSALYGTIFYFVARQTAAIQAMPAPVFATTTPAVIGDPTVDANGDPVVGERGFDAPDRQTIVDQLAARRPLNDDRRRELHVLFARVGKDAFPQNSGGGAITPDDVRHAINDSGQLPSATDNDPNPGPDFFVIAAGRIEVSDDRALFEPADHSLETVRVSAPTPTTDTITPILATPTTPFTPTAADARAASQIVMQQVGNRLTSQQLQRLFIEFSSNNGVLQSSSTAGLVSSQILASTIYPDGSLFLITTHGQLRLGRTGIVQSRTITAPAFITPNPFATVNGAKTVSPTPAILIVSEAVFSILLSIYLLVIGILTLRQHARSRRLHVIFAVLKIPLSIVCGVGWYWLLGTFLGALPNNGGNPLAAVRAFVLVIVSVVAILYPVGLLITFMTPSVKRYYNTGPRTGTAK